VNFDYERVSLIAAACVPGDEHVEQDGGADGEPSEFTDLRQNERESVSWFTHPTHSAQRSELA
jgi:hypothetical protein